MLIIYLVFFYIFIYIFSINIYIFKQKGIYNYFILILNKIAILYKVIDLAFKFIYNKTLLSN